MSDQRLIDLETKFSFQEALIEELRQTVHEQHLAMEKLEKALKVLTERLKANEEGAVDTSHQKPPHY